MDSKGVKFGKGPKELNGSVDLINYYKLGPLHNLFCKKSVPSTISETKYLQNVVGDTEIRKGEGMGIDNVGDRQLRLRPFDLGTLMEAFQLKEENTIDLQFFERGSVTTTSKLKIERKDKKKRKRQRKNGIEEGKDHKKQKRDDCNKIKKDKGRNHA